MPNAVDFFTGVCADGSPSDDVTDAAEFGLCDDPHEAGIPKKRAYLDTATPDKWLARVLNGPRFEVTFKGVDDCIAIDRAATMADVQVEEASRCDGILLYHETIIFVELKGKNRGWVNSAIDQLEATIKVFATSHDLTAYPRRLAYAVNSRHPTFPEGRIQRNNSYFVETGVVLRTKAVIDLEPLV